MSGRPSASQIHTGLIRPVIVIWPSLDPHMTITPFIRPYPDFIVPSARFQTEHYCLVYASSHYDCNSTPKGKRIVNSSMSSGGMQFLVADTVIGFGGVVLFYSSKRLSKRYNAWTTRLRTRFPGINPAPTPKKAQSNYWTMVILFRIGGTFLFFASIWAAYDSFH